MNRKEKLKEFCTKLSELQGNLTKAHQDFEAHGAMFNEWLHTECGFSKDKLANVLMPEILMKWDETSDNQTQSNH